MRQFDRFLLLFVFNFLLSITVAYAQGCAPDTEPPVFLVGNPILDGIANGDVLYYQCGEQEAFYEEFLTATDNCDPEPDVNFSKTVELGICPSDGYMVSIDYCWEAIDATANINQFCFKVYVEDEEPPSFDQYPADLTINLSAGDTLPPVDILSAFDDCQGQVLVSFDLELFLDPDGCGYTLHRIWSAADDCTNEISHTQIITAEEDCDSCPTNIIENLSVQPASCNAQDGSMTVEVAGDPSEYTYFLAPNSGMASGSGEVISGLPANDYQLSIYHQSIPDCQAVINFTIGQSSCSDTISVNIDGTEEVCIDDSVFDFDGDITSVIFCAQGSPSTVLGTMADSVCLTLVPANGFVGISPDLLCIVHCFDNDPAMCDSTFISVNVLDCNLQLDDVIISPETCAGNDGSFQVLASGQNGSLSYNWSPQVSISNFALNLSSDQDYSLTLIDGTGCTLSIDNLNVGLDCPTPSPDTFALEFNCGDIFLHLCASMDELQGGFSSLSICSPPANGSLTALSDTCMVYQPNADFNGIEMACLLLCDDLGTCDTFVYEIDVEQCPQQIPCVTIPEDTLFVQTNTCSDEVKFCIEFPLGEILNYDFSLNGLPYAGNLSVCAFDTIVSYGFSAIPGNGMNGPYELSSWVIDGSNVGNGTFDDVFDLIDLMNIIDPVGNWALDTITFNISSYNTQTAYGQLTVSQQTTGDVAMLNINSATAPTGSALYFPVGTHEVILSHQDYSFCVDTFTAFVHCAEKEIIFDTILVDELATYCPSFQLPGAPQSFDIVCDDCDNVVTDFNTGCVDYRGLSNGTDEILIISCDEFGFCDSTLLIVTVTSDGLPFANIDNVSTTENREVTLDVLDNDFVNGNLESIRILIDPTHGLAVVNSDLSVTFTPDQGYCGLDAFAYEICNEIGCDTSAVEVEVICTQPVVYTGFSPNEDGKNDFFKITNLEHYPENELIIFNRWGSQIYQKKNYNNDWDGRDYDNSMLPDGTYFYLLNLGRGETLNGYVQINR